MKHRKRILLIPFCLLLLGGLAWQVLRPKEPVYQGKTLTQWLRQGIGASTAEDEKPVTDAVLNMGTNALPILLQKIQATDSPLKLKFISLIEKQSIIEFEFTPAWKSRTEACQGFCILGPLAKPAVPKLTELLQSDDPGYVAQSLAGIGVDGALPLVQALTNSSLGIKYRALDALREMGVIRFITNFPPDRVAMIPEIGKIAVRPLLESLESKDYLTRLKAARALGALGCEPDLVVPALLKDLRETDADSQVTAPVLEALEIFGPKAKAAVPALLQTLNHPNLTCRSCATNALKAIDPSTAAQTGVK